MEPLTIPRLTTTDPDFAEHFRQLIAWESEDLTRVEAVVSGILKEIREKGDTALLALTERFDRITLTAENLAFTSAEIDQACAQVSKEEMEALELAARRIRVYHQRQTNESWQYRDETGTLLGQRITPIGKVGLYVPGGRASYPSSVLMNAIPARVAGVTEVIMAVPTPDGVLNPLVLAAARIAGVDRIFKIGGAQAIAAMAYGTATVPAVDKIVGPGNIYVAMAKRQVFGQVGIDMIAGPSEILVVADRFNNPAWIAADLLSQAEHDEEARAILVTDSPTFADHVVEAIAAHLVDFPRREICLKSLARRGCIIITRDLNEACELASRIAPEHLELAVGDPEALLPRIRNAGAIFLGRFTPEAMGDYVAGPNHVLPTGGTARFSSPLGVYDFIKRTSLIGCSPAATRTLGPTASLLAQKEGLPAHALSVDLRILP